MSTGSGLKLHFAARWTAVKAKRLRECGAKLAEIGRRLGISAETASRMVRWDGEGPIYGPRSDR